MTDQVTQQQVNNTAWAACDTFRGAVDAAQYKDYILVMLFLKYISDLWNDHIKTYKKQFGGDETRIRRRLERERFILPKGTSYYDLCEARNEANIGELINVALEKIEDANRSKLEGVFRNIDFNSEANLDQGPQPPPQEPAGGLCQARAGLEPLARHRGHHWRVLHLPHLEVRLRRRQEGGRVLYAHPGVQAVGQAGGQLLPLRPGGERRDLGARQDEHVPARQGRRAHRVV
jgi:hypothetical protein